jgi:hypothetical protein
MSKVRKILNLSKKYRNYKQAIEHLEVLTNKYEDTNHLYLQFKTAFPPGHFYSPYPDLHDVNKRHQKLFDRSIREIPGIDIREKQQLNFLTKLSKHNSKLPYSEGRDKSLRYHFNNTAYSYTDATVLFCLLNEINPKRIIEIGSGHSSALMLDVNENFFNNSIDLTFIEPYPELLLSLIKPQDNSRFKLIGQNLSEVDNKIFSALGADDVLFVDSTHVSKIGSDVNQIIFDILPKLNRGVIVHIHDVFYPFEYPEEWVLDTRAWNEDYMLRAFLHNNNEYEILFFNHFMNLHHKKEMEKLLPTTKKNAGGSIWLRKTG